jgi:cytochrome c biogenesis protein CcmG/thiol:disulfide interchange protein DsbE
MSRSPVRILSLLCFLAAAGVIRAEVNLPVLNVGAEVYSNVTVFSVTATDIYFSYRGGMGNAKLKNLEPGLQKKFHFDAAKAAEKERQQAGANTLYRQVLKESKPLKHPPLGLPANQQAEPSGSGDEVPPHKVYAKSFLNQPSPGISAGKWLTPQPLTAGKFILVEFWATWCPSCRLSIPELNDFYHKFQDRLAVVGLSDEAEQEVGRLAISGIDYAVAIDPQRRASRAFGVQAIPHAVLVDPKGIVRFEGQPRYLDEKRLAALLDKYAD